MNGAKEEGERAKERGKMRHKRDCVSVIKHRG